MTGLMVIVAGLLGPAVLTPLSTPHVRVAHAVARILPIHRTVVASTPVRYQQVMMVEQVKRKVYPYSLVPGGAQNVREAKLAMSDASVKVNYASFRMDQLHEEKLTRDMRGYVSYRWGDAIYWTAKPITLHAGETIFTDGTNIARGRCLNCYSALPMQPIRPHEPTEKALDVAIEIPMTVYTFPELPLYAPALPVPPAELTPTVPVLPAGGLPGPVAAKPGGGFFFPIIPIIPPIHRHPTSPTSGPPIPGGPPNGPNPPPPPPTTVVPEPSYVLLLGAGGLAILLMHRRRKRAA
ncbi:MAG TPA: PEP-CTERM sorting domain-containing protein [Bryobacteraceae bacterium]|nr:PEP-CTERM sorting domain-containing protein [Bryobacteraceae bacterium]